MGCELRQHLYEDVAVLVEDMLFERVDWFTMFDRTTEMLDEALFASDYDGVLYICFYHLRLTRPYKNPVPQVDRFAFRGARHVHMVKLLLSLFAARTPGDITDMFMFYAISGRANLLQFACDTMNVPRRVVDIVVCELERALSELRGYHLMCWSFPSDKVDGICLPVLWEAACRQYMFDCANRGVSLFNTSFRINLEGNEGAYRRCVLLLKEYREGVTP